MTEHRVPIVKAWTENRRAEGARNQIAVLVEALDGRQGLLVDHQGTIRLLAVNHASLIAQRAREGGAVNEGHWLWAGSTTDWDAGFEEEDWMK